MDIKQWNEIKEKLSRPKWMLSFVMIGGLLANALILLYVIGPGTSQAEATRSQAELLQMQITGIQHRPLPEKLSEKELLSFVKQVPLKEETDPFILSLRDAERVSSITIQSIKLTPVKTDKATAPKKSNPSGTAQPAAQAKPNEQAKAGQPAVNANSKPQGKAVQPTPNANPQEQSSLETIQLNVQLIGNYEQLQLFLQRLQNIDRIIQIDSWKIQRANVSVPSDSIGTNSANLQMNVTLLIFAAPQYNGKLPDVSGL